MLVRVSKMTSKQIRKAGFWANDAGLPVKAWIFRQRCQAISLSNEKDE
jgi:hypothetical protein